MSRTNYYKYLSPTSLSPRQKEYLNLVREGMCDKRIARIMNITISTVKTFGANIRIKLGAVNRTHAVILAIRQNQINLEEAH